MTLNILTENLTKYYGPEKNAAVDKLSIKISAGEVYGFLGANGAGKTTAIRMLMGFLNPSSGKAEIMGLDSVKDSVEIKKKIGYLPGDVALYTKPSGRELLSYLGRLQGGSSYRKVLQKRFEADLDKPIGQLSKGNRQKIGIIQAMMHQPQVLILDEPTSGLDPLMQEAVYLTISELKDQGTAILMSSHNLTEAQRICDRIGILKHGKLIKEQKMDNSTELGSSIYKVKFVNGADADKVKVLKILSLINQIDKQTLLIQPKASITTVLKALSNYELSEFTTQTLDLEDEFIEYYGSEK